MQQDFRDIPPDKPVSKPPDDRLGYDALARHVAASIQAMTAPEGFVIAVHGRWGSGKTSLLNLIEYHLQHHEGDNERDTPTIVRFNPWWFSSREDIAKLLFGQFLAKLSGRTQEANRLRVKLANFAKAVSDVPIPYASGAKVIAEIARPEAKDVPALKAETGELLRRHGKRFLVVIDDIDRLTPSEMVQLFRVVKAVGGVAPVWWTVHRWATTGGVVHLLWYASGESSSRAECRRWRLSSSSKEAKRAVRLPMRTARHVWLTTPDRCAAASAGWAGWECTGAQTRWRVRRRQRPPPAV